MKSFACVVLLAAVALAAPEGKRDKRGHLHGGYSLGHSSDLSSGFGSSYGYDSGLSYSSYSAPAARLVSYNKVVEVPKVVEVKKIVSVPKVVSVPQIVKVSKLVHEPAHHVSYSLPASSGWW